MNSIWKIFNNRKTLNFLVFLFRFLKSIPAHPSRWGQASGVSSAGRAPRLSSSGSCRQSWHNLSWERYGMMGWSLQPVTLWTGRYWKARMDKNGTSKSGLDQRTHLRCKSQNLRDFPHKNLSAMCLPRIWKRGEMAGKQLQCGLCMSMPHEVFTRCSTHLHPIRFAKFHGTSWDKPWKKSEKTHRKSIEHLLSPRHWSRPYPRWPSLPGPRPRAQWSAARGPS